MSIANCNFELLTFCIKSFMKRNLISPGFLRTLYLGSDRMMSDILKS